MVHRCKKCNDILKVASVGGGEHASLKACHFSHFWQKGFLSDFEEIVYQLN